MLTHDEHAAEALVQDTMMRAYRHIETFQPGTHMRAWLMTILRRTHIDRHRRDARRLDAGSLDAMGHDPVNQPSPPEPTDAWTSAEELLERIDDPTLEAALRGLPEPMRSVLLLVDVEQMTVAEAAEALGVPPGTVKSRASRARRRLRDDLLPIAESRGWIARQESETPS